MDLSTIFQEEVEVELDLGKLGKLNVVYNPQAYTPDAEERVHAAINQAKEGGIQSRWLIEFMPAFLKRWDLLATTKEDAARFDVKVGQAVPTTRIALAQVPTAFLLAVFNGIVENNSPNVKSSSPRVTSSSTEDDGEQ